MGRGPEFCFVLCPFVLTVGPSSATRLYHYSTLLVCSRYRIDILSEALEGALKGLSTREYLAKRNLRRNAVVAALFSRTRQSTSCVSRPHLRPPVSSASHDFNSVLRR